MAAWDITTGLRRAIVLLAVDQSGLWFTLKGRNAILPGETDLTSELVLRAGTVLRVFEQTSAGYMWSAEFEWAREDREGWLRTLSVVRQ